jgi:hypothetical protein
MTSDTGAIRFASLALLIIVTGLLPQLPQQLNPGSPMRRPTGEPNVMSPDLNESKPFCSPQDQMQWGILFLGRHLRGLSPWEREECLQDV